MLDWQSLVMVQECVVSIHNQYGQLSRLMMEESLMMHIPTKVHNPSPNNKHISTHNLNSLNNSSNSNTTNINIYNDLFSD